jgi:hypothetical protein
MMDLEVDLARLGMRFSPGNKSRPEEKFDRSTLLSAQNPFSRADFLPDKLILLVHSSPCENFR